uniref:Costars family protein ABRACL n=1 Tax=Laticauda laticaudata TaxID=8630 RepID=A0A8C5S7Q3_LATLA
MNVEHEINLLVEEIWRLGTKNPDGTLSVKFSYSGELLLQGVHDILLLQD